MIDCKTFTFDNVAAYAAIFGMRGHCAIDAWMDEVCKKTPFVQFDLKAMYTNEQGQVVLTYFAMKSDKVNVFYEFRHLALQDICLN